MLIYGLLKMPNCRITTIIIVLCLLVVDVYPEPKVSKLADGNDKQSGVPHLRLSVELLHRIAAKNYDENIFFSPFSIYNCLLLLYLASAGNTQTTLEELLYKNSLIPSKSEIMETYFDRKHSVNKTNKKLYELDLANRIYLARNLKVKTNLGEQIKKLFAVFKTENKHEKEINDWVSNQTKEMIKELFKDGSLRADIQLILASAAYFKGFWVHPFLKETVTKPFILPDGNIIKTEFMTLRNGHKMVTDTILNAEVIALPYKGDDMDMIIIFPKLKPEKNAPPYFKDIMKKLTFDAVLRLLSAAEQANTSSIMILVPKFESEQEYDLNPMLSDLGAKPLLIDVNLTSFIESDKPMKIDRFVHKAKVKVHEDGTEAAATTGVAIVAKSLPFCINHPFIYIIYDKSHKVIHFMGVLSKPKEIK